MKLNNVDLLRLIPVFMQDDSNFKALAYAINDEFKLLHTQTKLISLYKNIDNLPENIIDELAEQFSITEYNKTYNLSIKRNLVRNCFATHRRRGTVASVEDVCAKIFGDALVEEWFEYGGEPYHFKVYTENLNVSDTMVADFKRVINETKNVRSHLDELVVSAMNSMDLYVGMEMGFSDDFFITTEEYNGINVMFFVENGELKYTEAYTMTSISLIDISTGRCYGFSYNADTNDLYLIEYEIPPLTATKHLTVTDTAYRKYLEITSDGINHGGYYKVSDEAPTIEQLRKGGAVSFNEGNTGVVTMNYPEGTMTILEGDNRAVIAFNGLTLVVVAFKDGASYFGNTFDKGVYFVQDDWVVTHSFTFADIKKYNIFVDNGELFYELI